MKKNIIILMLVAILLTGCTEKKEKETKIDYSKYLFTDVVWTRDSGHDIETIKFGADGSFRYYCACGNSVNDSDLCESYTYNDKTKEIKLNCIETTEDTIKTIKIIKYNEKELELDFNGERKIFNIDE